MKRLLSAILCAVLALALFAGCGDEAPPDVTPSPGEPGTVTAPGTDGGGELGVDDDPLPLSPRTTVTGILSQPDQPWRQIVVSFLIRSGGEEDGPAVTLSAEDAERVHHILSAMDAEEIPTPYHYESQQSESPFTIFIQYENGSEDTIRSNESGIYFYRYTDTVGDHGDNGYVGGRSEELYEILAAQYAALE